MEKELLESFVLPGLATGDVIRSLIADTELSDFILKVAPDFQGDVHVVNTADPAAEVSGEAPLLVVNLFRSNDIRYINKSLERLNRATSRDSIYVGCFETFTARRARKKIYQIPVLNKLMLLSEFMFLRILPKIKGLNKLYFAVSGGRGRLLSKAEMLGRLVCCGYEILGYQQVRGLSYFVARKVKDPVYDLKPSYGPVFAMPRIGKNGKSYVCTNFVPCTLFLSICRIMC